MHEAAECIMSFANCNLAGLTVESGLRRDQRRSFCYTIIPVPDMDRGEVILVAWLAFDPLPESALSAITVRLARLERVMVAGLRADEEISLADKLFDGPDVIDGCHH